MERQQIVISGLGGQGVLFITRLLAETALHIGLDVLSSETHGMAMRGGAVVSHLKVGPFASPLVRAGQADLVIFLAAENLTVHPAFIGEKSQVLINAASHDRYDGLDAAAEYRVRVTMVVPRMPDAGAAPEGAKRLQSILADGEYVARDVEIPVYTAQMFEYDVPGSATHDGTLELVFERGAGSIGVVVSEVWLIKK